jgi:hypothetical protein
MEEVHSTAARAERERDVLEYGYGESVISEHCPVDRSHTFELYYPSTILIEHPQSERVVMVS